MQQELETKPPKENIQSLVAGAVVPSKDGLKAYWKKVMPDALRYLGRRPLRLVRSVGGVTFYHGGPLPPAPAGVYQLRTQTREGGPGIRLWVDSLEGLLGLVDMDVVELHPWGSTVDDIEHPDVLTFDLEPGAGVEWHAVVGAGVRLRALLAKEGLASWPKLTGHKDLHVVAPIKPKMKWDDARAYCKGLAEKMAAAAPERFTVRAGPPNRVGRIYIDYLRNGRGTTAVGAYSPRALPGFPIAAPVTWKELEKGLRPDAFSLDSPPKSGRRTVPKAITVKRVKRVRRS